MSYFHKVGEKPLVYKTLGQQLSIVAKKSPDKEAFVFVEDNKKLTYGQLLNTADRLAAAFECLGLERGDRVGILAPNVSVVPVAFYAAARAGLISVSLNPTSDAQEIEKCLAKVSAKVLIASENFGSTKYYDKLLEIIPELRNCTSGHIKSTKLPFLTTIIIDSETCYKGTLQLKDVMSLPTLSQINHIEQQQDLISPDNGCNIQFTSGFTGPPKAVLISHLCLINSGFQFGKCQLQNTRICLPLPFCHSFAVAILSAAVCSNATIIVPNIFRDPKEILHAISKEKCDVMIGVSTMFIKLLSIQSQLGTNKYDISTLKIGVIGGTLCSSDYVKKIKKEMGLKKLRNVYGMTELVLSFAPLAHHSDEEVMETIGCAVDHTEVKVLDSDGQLVPLGTPGELYVRGYNTMIKYWGDEEKTKEILDKDGWLRTGDYFILEPNGYGKIIGRISDIITKGIHKIFPKEIENLLGTHPNVSEICVLGVPDEHLGKELCAFVSLRNDHEPLTPEDVYEFCKGKLAPFEIPRYVYLVKDFPKTLSGKVKKSELNELYAKRI